MTTDEQKLNAINEQRIHIDHVRKLLTKVAFALIERGHIHDRSKLNEPELSPFAESIIDLKDISYDSEEYAQRLAKLKPCLDHHYAQNRHHPEHFANGIEDMDLIDLIEMLVDWKAATLKHNDGNLCKSIQHNIKRFNIDSQLAKILNNTANMMDDAG